MSRGKGTKNLEVESFAGGLYTSDSVLRESERDISQKPAVCCEICEPCNELKTQWRNKKN